MNPHLWAMNSSKTIFMMKTECMIFLIFWGLVLAHPAEASDWPTYRKDYARSGVSADAIVLPMKESWVFRSHQKPQPAWQGEAKWDGYNKVYNMKARQTFDRCFDTVNVGDQVFWASSADDKVYCYNAATGQEEWAFYTDGPVRLAPTVIEGKVYVGSDDGYAYCLQASDGALLWREHIAPGRQIIPGNGRLVSKWPIRTSIAVMDGIAYCSAGMFPSEGVYLSALDAGSGKQIWQTVNMDLPAQGYILASADRLYVPAGRNNPVIYRRHDGSRLRVVSGQGGTYCLLTDDMLVFGPGKTGTLGMVEEGSSDQLATFSGNHMIVTPAMSFLHSDTDISALDRNKYLSLAADRKKISSLQSQAFKKLKELEKENKDSDAATIELIRKDLIHFGRQIDEISSAMVQCQPWKMDCKYPASLILAGDYLFAGGENGFGVYHKLSGEQTFEAVVEGTVYGMSAGNGRVFVSTDLGRVYCYESSTLVGLNP